ncbi:MAG: hypothetical protein DMD34_06125 [Gemmatimonadetes bacterium]|nr:MAG: hypothetical protein DMD46_12710 [Gemmatimonadota bacterium]PYP95870.1 MAG: hypothetical protein DMD34_06125 [Gemmatimonadota bacterium]
MAHFDEGALMSKTLLGIMLLVDVAPVSAQDWRAQLKADAVVVRGGKMVYDEVGVYKINVTGYAPAQVQVKVHSEAVQGGVVSRDNFVSLTARLFSLTLTAALSESYHVPANQFLRGLDYTQLNAGIGTPDLVLNLVMTNEGMELEAVNVPPGQSTRHTMTWEQLFAK